MLMLGYITFRNRGTMNIVSFELLYGISSFSLLYFFYLGFSMLRGKNVSRFLIMPATNLEKYVCLILSSVVLPVFFYGSIFVLYEFIYELVTRSGFSMRSLAGNNNWVQALLTFCLGWVLFVLGQFYFKKSAMLKTFLSIMIIGFIFSTVENILLKLLSEQASLLPVRTDLLSAMYIMDGHRKVILDDGLFHQYPILQAVIVIVFTAALVWISYLKLKEREAKI